MIELVDQKEKPVCVSKSHVVNKKLSIYLAVALQCALCSAAAFQTINIASNMQSVKSIGNESDRIYWL